MIKKNRLYIIGLVIFTQLLTACSPLEVCYLRNTTKDSISLTLKGIYPNTDIASKPLFVKYKNGIANIKKGLYTELNNQLEVKKIDDYTFTITVPPQSTVLLGFSDNSFNPLYQFESSVVSYSIDNIIIKTITKEIMLSRTNIKKDFGYKERGMEFMYYYDVQ